ncbi:hypothetical protein Ddye_009015 [Dipteronia dyeriana]|uniref:Uncharacterized protein n=1 Tax=Dipteronia dyeriana TaxID=168575 RepID=A0AAE0CMH8_9ROSI|nr:hypothetical protein Ddye_009015 [Dipteronia dyeriana]
MMYKLLSNSSCSLFKAFCKCLGCDHDHDYVDHPETHDQQTDANSTSEAERHMKINVEEYGLLASPPMPPISSRVGDQIDVEEDGLLARSPPRPPISSRVGDQINGEEDVLLARSPPRPHISSRGDQINGGKNGLLARSPPRSPISSRVEDQINEEEDGLLARSPPRPPISSRGGDHINNGRKMGSFARSTPKAAN